MAEAGLPQLAVVVVLGSALVHATWNILLARVPRGHDTTAVALTLGLAAWTPVALARWRVEAAAWPYVAASAALELAYFAALNLAYARAPAHTTYPVARGLAPALLLPIAAIGGGRLPGRAGLGVLAISAGVLLTVWGEADRRAVFSAVPVAACIAGYTYIDAAGLHHADPAAYLWLVMCPVVIVLLATRLAVSGGPRPLVARVRGSTVVLGAGVFGAYGLTLAALALVSPAQVPAVAALRESSILFVLALSWLTTWRARRAAGEAQPARRRGGPTPATALGALFVFGGVAALALG